MTNYTLMHQTIVYLIFAVCFISAILSLFLYMRDKSNEKFKLQLYFWVVSSCFTFFVMRNFSDLLLSLFLIGPFVINILQHKIMTRIYSLEEYEPSNSFWVKALLFATALTLCFFYLKLDFLYLSMPLALISASPVALFFYRYKQIKEKNAYDYLLLLSFLITGIHMLDYPFLRKSTDPEILAFGFSAFFILIFAKAITIPYLVLSHSEKEHQDKLKEEIQRVTNELNEANMAINYSSKMSALGEMAAGVAHEVNNPLAIIISMVRLLKKSEEKGKLTSEKLTSTLDEIENTVGRAAKIIAALKTISQDSSDGNAKAVVLKDILTNIFTLFSGKLLEENIEVHIDWDAPILNEEVIVNNVQLSQVLVSLLSNSFDAIKELKEKWVKIDVVKQESLYKIKVIDSGPGIPPEIHEKIFNPFFTLKPIGQGTGLGLSTSKRVMEQSGGDLYLDTSGPNTCFVVNISVKPNSL